MTGPLSFAQQRMWFFARLEPENPMYNALRASRWVGPFDRDALERSLAELVRRHALLRTRFPATESGPVAQVDPPGQFHLPVQACAAPPESREEEARAWAVAQSRRPFDLTREHPLRAALLRLSPQEHLLALVIHQIAFDRWSRDVLRRELVALYSAFAAGQPGRLSDLPLQYQEYARSQAERVASGALSSQLAYWRARLSSAPPVLELPTDRPRPATRGYRGAQARMTVPPALVESLGALARGHRATLFMAMLSAFKTLLMRWTGETDLVVGVPISGRPQPALEPLIGCFTNTLVLRTDLSGDPSFRELLGRVRQVALGAYARQEIPFEVLVRELQPERSTRHHPIFQVLFNQLPFTDRGPEIPGLRVDDLDLDPATALVDLSLEVRVQGPALACRLTYDSELFDASSMDRLMQRYRLLLEGAAAAPDRRLTALGIASEEIQPGETRRVLQELNEMSEEAAERLLAAELQERTR